VFTQVRQRHATGAAGTDIARVIHLDHAAGTAVATGTADGDGVRAAGMGHPAGAATATDGLGENALGTHDIKRHVAAVAHLDHIAIAARAPVRAQRMAAPGTAGIAATATHRLLVDAVGTDQIAGIDALVAKHDAHDITVTVRDGFAVGALELGGVAVIDPAVVGNAFGGIAQRQRRCADSEPARVGDLDGMGVIHVAAIAAITAGTAIALGIQEGIRTHAADTLGDDG